MDTLANGRMKRPAWNGLIAALIALAASPVAVAQMTPEQQAEALLSSARRAYNERNYPVAISRFQEFATKFGGQKEANSARYGLALAFIESPERKLAEAIALLQPLAANKDLPDHPYALYYLGHAQRSIGLQELAQGVAKPQEAPQRRNNANQRFDEAARQYAAAVAAFTARAKVEEGKELPVEFEWAARARCDQAEMQLRLLKAKEAQATVAPFLQEPNLVKSRYRRLALYHHGFASLLLKDNLAAGKSLNQLTPFTDPVFGTHARYLLARVHHADGERAEAAGHFQGVVAQHEKEVKDAKQAITNPGNFKDNPEELARLTALANSRTPDHISRATLYLGILQYEDGKFAEALARFNEFHKQFPTSPLAAEVQLRIGFCQVQMKQWAEALKTLAPLVDKSPQLADQALLWMGKAQAGMADPANQQAWMQAQRLAIDTVRRAADRANANEPEVRARRGQILMELSDLQQAATLNKDAAGTLAQILSEKLLPQREEEVTQRQATALHLAGDYPASDKVCESFRTAFPKSPLLPAVLFRYSENATFTAIAAEKVSNLQDRDKKLAALNDEAIKRYQVVVEKFPEFAHANLARYGLAMGHYRKDDLEKARTVLETIPQDAWNGDVAVVPYVLADCLIRTAPVDAEDALAAGKLTEQMNKAAELLNGFVSSQPKSAQAPDALLKLGHCYQRLSEVQAQPQERQAKLANARQTYEKLSNEYQQHPLRATAMYERARVMAQAGDPNGAINELRRFRDAPLSASPVAPMALLRLATLLRTQNKAAEAAEVMVACRKAHEASLGKDPARASWVPLLQYHHGLALKESGKLPDARQVFDGVVKQFGNQTEGAESALRMGQCLKDEGKQKVDLAKKNLAIATRKPEEKAQDQKTLDDGLKQLREAVQYLEGQAEALKAKKPDLAARGRMLYDAAWAARALADEDVATVRARLRQERLQKLRDEAMKKVPPGGQAPYVAMPDVPVRDVPVQESEKKVRTLYQTLIAQFPDLEQNADARFELAELLSDRGEHDAAVKLLQEALDREPPQELTERVRLRLGVCLAAKGDHKAAQAQFDAVARNEKSTLRPQAAYRAGECQLLAKDFDNALKSFALFRDNGAFQNIPGVSDRALLRLGHVLGHVKQWDASRQAHETLLQRFPQSPWIHDARYGIGWAHQHKGEYDQAVNAYNQVTSSVATELAARAQLNVGLCRLAQKRHAEACTALLVVPFTYDYPDLNAMALLEAARALAEDKQADKAISVLQRLLRDHPDGEWVEPARKRLEELKKG